MKERERNVSEREKNNVRERERERERNVQEKENKSVQERVRESGRKNPSEIVKCVREDDSIDNLFHLSSSSSRGKKSSRHFKSKSYILQPCVNDSIAENE
jgi:hypothetical protein